MTEAIGRRPNAWHGFKDVFSLSPPAQFEDGVVDVDGFFRTRFRCECDRSVLHVCSQWKLGSVALATKPT